MQPLKRNITGGQKYMFCGETNLNTLFYKQFQIDVKKDGKDLTADATFLSQTNKTGPIVLQNVTI